jgi:hypothetical protein
VPALSQVLVFCRQRFFVSYLRFIYHAAQRFLCAQQYGSGRSLTDCPVSLFASYHAMHPKLCRKQRPVGEGLCASSLLWTNLKTAKLDARFNSALVMPIRSLLVRQLLNLHMIWLQQLTGGMLYRGHGPLVSNLRLQNVRLSSGYLTLCV